VFAWGREKQLLGDADGNEGLFFSRFEHSQGMGEASGFDDVGELDTVPAMGRTTLTAGRRARIAFEVDSGRTPVGGMVIASGAGSLLSRLLPAFLFVSGCFEKSLISELDRQRRVCGGVGVPRVGGGCS